MISYIDEAGTFVSKGAAENSWCTVACYTHPEFEKRKLTAVLRQLKLQEGFSQNTEIKLKNISENGYINFLKELGHLNGSLFCVATDSSFNSIDKINSHKNAHIESILRGQNEMKYDGGKEAMRILHKQLSGLPEQLYVQFHCQAVLLSLFIQRGIAFYVQRYPNSLKSFRWRYDAKELLKITDFEDSFQKFVPTLLQAYSIDNPTAVLDWCDYSPMKKYIGTIPDYLAEKVPELEGKEAFDIQKIIRDDIQFIDSKSCSGVQVADLLASGLRRLLRLEFNNNSLVAKNFGKLLLQEKDNKPPIALVAFDGESKIDKDLAAIIKTMINNSQRFLK
ncbi:DUF3800 domain-containing protein [Marinomonas sp. PE14-40]|uniref:DUF3800 domain-containing protein n=1 Tax=Marinomonas sp. PE14-40 TaxID=3060621 RepID=UPI003F678102